jgi:S-adenosylmethionine decarboxylase
MVDDTTTPHAGKHLLLDFYGCEMESLDPDSIKKALEVICTDIGATVLYSYAHEFCNGGSSGAIVLAESHCTWHHWIDEKFVAIDLFVCGNCNPSNAIDSFTRLFRPNHTKTSLHLRGIGFIG